MHWLKTTLLSVLATLTVVTALAQNVSEWERERYASTRNGMYVLGSWAIGNVAVSSVGMFRGSGVNYHFHQMNLAWNVVNLSLVGANLYFTKALDNPSAQQVSAKSINTEKILLLNAGLDVAYITTGALLAQDKYTDHQVRNRGWGRSLMMQGGFLLVFDLLLHHKLQSLRLSQTSNVGLSPYPGGMSLVVNW
jgi:hypothetical protein